MFPFEAYNQLMKKSVPISKVTLKEKIQNEKVAKISKNKIRKHSLGEAVLFMFQMRLFFRKTKKLTVNISIHTFKYLILFSYNTCNSRKPEISNKFY